MTEGDIAANQAAEHPSLSRFKAMPLVQANPLNSSDALKMRKELSQSDDGEKEEVPFVRSLFDVKGNSKFKPENERKSEDLLKASEGSDDGHESEEEEKKEPLAAAKPSFIGKHEFKNPFLPKKDGASAVFSTGVSLWANPFAQVQHSTGAGKASSWQTST